MTVLAVQQSRECPMVALPMKFHLHLNIGKIGWGDPVHLGLGTGWVWNLRSKIDCAYNRIHE